MSGCLKLRSKWKLAWDPQHPQVSQRMFQWYDWHDLYRRASEAIPRDTPVSRGTPMTMHCFVDASRGSDRATRRSRTGILTFCNLALIIWFCKCQNTVEASTFGSGLQAKSVQPSHSSWIYPLYIECPLFPARIGGHPYCRCKPCPLLDRSFHPWR